MQVLHNIDFIDIANDDIRLLNRIIELYNFFEVDDKMVIDELNESIYRYVSKELEYQLESTYSFNFEFEEFMNEDGVFQILDGEVERVIDDEYDNIKSNIEYFIGMDLDELDIKNTINVEDIESRLSDEFTYEKYQNYENDEYKNDYKSSYNGDDIDKLFER